MRIDFQYSPQPTPESNRPSSPASPQATSSTASGLGQDQAQISGAHAQVQSLAAQASQLPEVREERVQALRQAVTSGSYRPAPELVAGALLVHMMAGTSA